MVLDSTAPRYSFAYLRIGLLGLACFVGTLLSAQPDSTWLQKPSLHISGYLDVYYVYDFNRPAGPERQDFLFNHNRHNEFNLNHGLVQMELDHAKYRANLALHTGTYVIDNYAAEPPLLQQVFEANVGLALNKKSSLWLDAGIFGSHIGFESAISMENFTLTRSLAAENSPYFLSGAKLSYEANDKWTFVGLVLNGWQRITRVQGNSMPSFGTQVHYRANDRVSLNWSTFIGTTDPDSTRRMRYFSNLYGKFELTERFGLIAGFDIGAQQRARGSEVYHVWMSPVLIARYAFNDTWQAAFRAEYYHDEMGVKIPTLDPGGFKTTGLSLNLDYVPLPNVMCRIEGRWLGSAHPVFERGDGLTDQNFIIAASVAISFAVGLLR